MPEVSIILPFKNAATWIIQTIESIQGQTFTDWELLCIDDHSTDTSNELVAQLAERDGRIQVLTNHSSGIIPALQTGFQHCTGTFLTRMDADDLMPVNRLQQMTSLLAAAPARTVVTGKVQYFSDTAVSEGYQKYAAWLNERIDREDHYQHIYRECVIASPNWMMRTEEARELDLFNRLVYPEDYDLCFHWMTSGFQLAVLAETTLLWQEHPLRTSRNSIIYDQESFFRLKLRWFHQLHSNHSSVGVVGWGQKGKLCSMILNELNFPHHIYDLHPERYAGIEQEQPILPATSLSDPILLIARYPEDLDSIKHFIEQQGYEIGRTAFWV